MNVKYSKSYAWLRDEGDQLNDPLEKPPTEESDEDSSHSSQSEEGVDEVEKKKIVGKLAKQLVKSALTGDNKPTESMVASSQGQEEEEKPDKNAMSALKQLFASKVAGSFVS